MSRLEKHHDDDKQKKSKYNKTYLESRKMVSFVLDKKTDKDIIDWLGKQENQSRSIREALRLSIGYQNFMTKVGR